MASVPASASPASASPASAFAAKLGVSAQSIANWESKGGPLKLQAASLERLQTLALESAAEA